jgi:GxxExxY protein
VTKPPILQVQERDYVDSRYSNSDVTDKIIHVFYDVYNELGCGFLESVYDRAMFRALQQADLTVERQVPIPVWFRGEIIADFRADLLVNSAVLIELKAVESLGAAHISQTLNYLRATTVETGLLLNFGPKPLVRRLAFSNERKKISVHQR